MTGSSPEERRGRESHTTGSPDATEKIGTPEEPGVNIHVHVHVNFASSMYSCASEISRHIIHDCILQQVPVYPGEVMAWLQEWSTVSIDVHCVSRYL